MVSMKELEMTEDLLVDELKKVIKKGEFKDATEAKAVKEVLESIKIVHCLRDGDEPGNQEEGYSGYRMPRYSGGWGNNRMPTYSGTVDFNGTYSGGNGGYSGNNYSGANYSGGYSGYSGHSIHDRMIAALEPLYDKAKSEHEKSEIDNWIARLRKEN